MSLSEPLTIAVLTNITTLAVAVIQTISKRHEKREARRDRKIADAALGVVVDRALSGSSIIFCWRCGQRLNLTTITSTDATGAPDSSAPTTPSADAATPPKTSKDEA